MTLNDYHFITTWRVNASPKEIIEILGDATGLVHWWPSVYLDVQPLEAGNAEGLGKVVALYTKGWLPYTLRWQFRVTEVRPPHGFTLEAWGDFVGRGIWTFEPEPPLTAAGTPENSQWVKVTYDWQIAAEKPLLKYFSFIMKPIFAANHHWAMAQGEVSLQLELARRRAGSPAERALIPPPPGPTFKFWLPRAGKALPPGSP